MPLRLVLMRWVNIREVVLQITLPYSWNYLLYLFAAHLNHKVTLGLQYFTDDNQHLELNQKHWQPVQLMEQRCNVHKSVNVCNTQSILCQLQLPDALQGQPNAQHIAVVHSTGDKGMSRASLSRKGCNCDAQHKAMQKPS